MTYCHFPSDIYPISFSRDEITNLEIELERLSFKVRKRRKSTSPHVFLGTRRTTKNIVLNSRLLVVTTKREAFKITFNLKEFTIWTDLAVVLIYVDIMACGKMYKWYNYVSISINKRVHIDVCIIQIHIIDSSFLPHDHLHMYKWFIVAFISPACHIHPTSLSPSKSDIPVKSLTLKPQPVKICVNKINFKLIYILLCKNKLFISQHYWTVPSLRTICFSLYVPGITTSHGCPARQ